MSAASLIDDETTCRVSSTLNRDVKQFGKKFLFDGEDETCWNSDQGSPQFIIMDFKKGVVPTELSFTFQGGFVGTNCSVYGTPPGDAEQQKLCEIYPEDVNTEQRFQLDALPASVPSIQMLEIRFDSSTDFYGRVTVYNLNVLG
eukprot:gene14199-19047_t